MPVAKSQNRKSAFKVLDGQGLSVEFLGTIVEGSPDWFLIYNSDGKILYSNSSFRTHFSITDGNEITDLLQLSNFKSERTLNSEMMLDSGYYEELIITGSNQQEIAVDVFIQTLSKGLYSAHLKDISEKAQLQSESIKRHAEVNRLNQELSLSQQEMKSMQSALVQSGKMAALGELSAGIAHELNQPLMTIRGYAQEVEYLLKNGNPNKSEVNNYLGEVIKSVDKMAKIIKYLRTFASSSLDGYRDLNINEILKETVEVFENQISKNGITIKTNWYAGKLNCFVNPIQIEQVFLNLLTNARDAVTAESSKGIISIRTFQDDKFVAFEVQDNGAGMSDFEKNKIFDPFFTTKEVGKGMGLGLSLSFSMIEKVNGMMLVDSSLGNGSKFTVKIPVDFRTIS